MGVAKNLIGLGRDVPGQRRMTRSFDRQVAALQVRLALLNGITFVGMPVTKVAARVCPEAGQVRPSPDLCNIAALMRLPGSVLKAGAEAAARNLPHLDMV